MRSIAIKTGLIIVFLLMTGLSFRNIDYIKGKNNNVCKELNHTVLAYLIFVDSDETYPWTEFDIQSTLDSLQMAVKWLESQAQAQEGVRLNIKTDYFIGKEQTTIERDLPKGSVKASVTDPGFKRGMQQLNEWGDRIVREAGQSLPPIKKDGLPNIESPRTKERLIAYLRDKYKVESVALLFMVNNYFKDDISIPVNVLSDQDVEFAVVSYKYPAVIAHNFLHLFGGADLFETPYRKSTRKIETAKDMIPQGIMQDPYEKKLSQVKISPVTKYLIGWQNTLKAKYQPLLTDRLVIDF